MTAKWKTLFGLLVLVWLMIWASVWQESQVVARLNPAVVGTVPAAAGCTASYGSELAVTGNATDAGGVEADDLDDWTNGGCNTFDSETTAYAGTYGMTAISVDNGDYFGRTFSAGLSAGSVYKLSVHMRHIGSGGDWGCYLARSNASQNAGLGGVLTSLDSTWEQRYKYFIFHSEFDSLTCWERGDNSGGIYLDNLSVEAATLCYGDELNVITDAATIGANETNDASDWTTVGAVKLTSGTTDPADGSYHLDFDANSAADGRAYRDLSGILTSGVTYFIKIKAKYISGDLMAFGLYANNTTAGSVDQKETFGFSSTSFYSTWQETGFSFVYSASKHRYLLFTEAGSSNNAHWYIDSISIKEITGE